MTVVGNSVKIVRTLWSTRSLDFCQERNNGSRCPRRWEKKQACCLSRLSVYRSTPILTAGGASCCPNQGKDTLHRDSPSKQCKAKNNLRLSVCWSWIDNGGKLPLSASLAGGEFQDDLRVGASDKCGLSLLGTSLDVPINFSNLFKLNRLMVSDYTCCIHLRQASNTS